LQSAQQDDKHKYLFVDLFTPYGNYTSTKSSGQNLLCLWSDYCGITLELLAAKPQRMQLHEVKYDSFLSISYEQYEQA